jgi:hypothetical protein
VDCFFRSSFTSLGPPLITLTLTLTLSSCRCMRRTGTTPWAARTWTCASTTSCCTSCAPTPYSWLSSSNNSYVPMMTLLLLRVLRLLVLLQVRRDPLLLLSQRTGKKRKRKKKNIKRESLPYVLPSLRCVCWRRASRSSSPSGNRCSSAAGYPRYAELGLSLLLLLSTVLAYGGGSMLQYAVFLIV